MSEQREKIERRSTLTPEEEQMARLPAEAVEEIEALGAVVDRDGVAEPGMMKVDLHCHTEASYDCTTPIVAIPDRCRARGLRIQAITDHNEIWGAQKMKAQVEEEARKQGRDLTIIVGEEVTTTEGEIIGLFLHERIEAGLQPEEAVEQIKAQGGLVLLPHGFDPLKRWRLKPEARERIAHDIDIVETFNARISRPRWNQAAVDWCKERGVLMSAGSDAHTPADVGSAWVELPRLPIRGPQDLLKALEGGVPVGEWTHPIIAYVYKVWDRWRRKVRGVKRET